MMFNRKSPAAQTGPVKQLDLDICLAITGGPKADSAADASQPEQSAEPQQWLTIPTSKTAMRQWVKQVQSRVVQVSDTVKARIGEASAQMGARMIDSSQNRRKAG